MKIQPELLSNSKATGLIQDSADNENLNVDFDIFFYEPNENKEMIIKSRKTEIKAIDRNIADGTILKVDAAIRQRKILLSGLINYMVTNRIVDHNILKKEGITEQEMLKKYYYHFHSTQFIRKTIHEHPFMELELNRLAAHGEPFSTKNGKEIARLNREIFNLRYPQSIMNLFRQVVNEGKAKELEYEKKDLEINDDRDIKYFPIENLCCMIQQSQDSGSNNNASIFGCYDYFKLSPTSHKRLIGLFVQLYNQRYKKEIAKYRKDKNRNSKNAKRNTKQTTATELKKKIKSLLTKGLKQKDIADKLGVDVRTIRRYETELKNNTK